MTTTIRYTFDDFERLQELVIEMDDAGRPEQADLLARLCGQVAALLTAELEVDDEAALDADLNEAERDIAERRTLPHDDVMRRLGLVDGTN